MVESLLSPSSHPWVVCERHFTEPIFQVTDQSSRLYGIYSMTPPITRFLRGAVRIQVTIKVYSLVFLGTSTYAFNKARPLTNLHSMTSFTSPKRMGSATSDSGTKGWLVSILELGAWFGSLCAGYLADRFSRKYTIVLCRSSIPIFHKPISHAPIVPIQPLSYSVSVSLYKQPHTIPALYSAVRRYPSNSTNNF